LSDKHSIANLVSHKKDFEKKEVEKDATVNSRGKSILVFMTDL
jgi:hypothetical protein